VPATEPSAEERELLQRYMDAHTRADSDAVVAMMRKDVRFTMPPQPTIFEGRAALAGFFAEAFRPGAAGEFRLVPTRANRHPAAANYLREPGPPHPPVTSSYRPSLPSSTVNSRSQRREANPGAPLKGRGRSRKRDDHPWPVFDLNDLVEHWP
jgi:hypothetical protein